MRRLLIATVVASCHTDPMCGAGSAQGSGIVASADGVMLAYGSFTAGQNNDCSDPSSGVTSVTIESVQQAATGLLNLCIPRLDLLDQGDRTLGTMASMADVRVTDVDGTANGCTFTLDASQPLTGTASGSGVCNNGSDSRGFALTLDGGATLQRTCGTTIDSVQVTLQGTVAVFPAM